MRGESGGGTGKEKGYQRKKRKEEEGRGKRKLERGKGKGIDIATQGTVKERKKGMFPDVLTSNRWIGS